MEIRLAAFDLDGTVLEHNSSWVAIHKHFGTEHEGATSLRLYTEGKIDYREFMRRDIGSWPKGVTKDEIRGVLSGYRIRREAPEVFEALRSKGIKTALVTSGIDLLAKEVARELGIDHWLANGLRFNKSGVLLPDGIGRVDPTRKDLAYKRLLAKIGVPAKTTIAVGDTIYDLAFLKSAGLGFMLAHTTRVSDPDIIHIDRLTEILGHL
ncbi:MAG: HAD-IB family phosphatase [Nitrososphaerota archaeon]|nr:HAD-IB family phosphatase [Nitrososphaerota archaeon]MDG7022887.1 HAD-IB family phosphatase [Nitrososphaerota archaeon]